MENYSLTILAGKSRAQLAPTSIYCDLVFILSGELNDPTYPKKVFLTK